MVAQTYRIVFSVVVFLFIVSLPVLGHDPVVHVEMSKKAAKESQGLQNFLSDIFPSISAPTFEADSVDPEENPKIKSASQWIEYGSKREDDGNILWVGNAVHDQPKAKNDYWYVCRCQHHFWDPITNKEIEELILQEEGFRFQRLAVALAKKRFPNLIATEIHRDGGEDALLAALICFPTR